jgi:energy-coupling factor transporter ATP-binding protein EcfA2
MTGSEYRLGEVFNEAQIPILTYVDPREAVALRATLETPGKHVTLVGPSGSGKSTLVARSLDALGIKASDVVAITGRLHSSAGSILDVLGSELGEEPSFDAITPWLAAHRFVLLDDAHHLGAGAREELTRLLKFWHEKDVRFILVGIASTASELVGADPELAIRNETFEMATQDEDFSTEVVTKGEKALNIEFEWHSRATLVRACRGIPSLLQLLCRLACVDQDVAGTQTERRTVEVDIARIGASVRRTYDPKYFEKTVGLAKGRRQARAVHDTYFEIVAELASSGLLEVPKERLYHRLLGGIEDPALKKRRTTSFYRALENLPAAIEENDLSDALLYAAPPGTLTVEDPLYRFYLDIVDVDAIRARINMNQSGYAYDIAVSFAGADRSAVLDVVRAMQELGIRVFYDFDEKAQLWGKDLRQVLADVYANEAQYMLVCLSADYPERDWPTFELEIGRDAATKRTDEYLLPLVLGEEVPHLVGLPSSVSRISIFEHTPREVAGLVLEKLNATER